MKIKRLKIKQHDGHITNVSCYSTDAKKKGNLLLLHGMAEFYERYDSFATLLAQDGYDVYLYSHRGHGKETPPSDLGFFAPKNGYEYVIKDGINILNTIRNIDPDHPLYLMGHSMGSLITRNIIQMYDDLDGVIICGTANPNRLNTFAGLLLSNLTGFRLFPKKRSPLMDRILFGLPLYTKLNTRTKTDWLCTDPIEVDKYMKDPYCGFICTKSFYHDLLTLTKRATNKKQILKTKKSIPIMIISGTKDPVGGYGKDIEKLIHFYESNNYLITSKLYKDLRHELLNEPCKLDITKDIMNFLNSIT